MGRSNRERVPGFLRVLVHKHLERVETFVRPTLLVLLELKDLGFLHVENAVVIRTIRLQYQVSDTKKKRYSHPTQKSNTKNHPVP